MITSVFSKSKPINFIITFFVVAIACIVSYVENDSNQLSVNTVGNSMLLLIGSYFGLLVLNFIAVKNSLTQTTYFEIVLFALFILLFPQTTENLNIILANTFLLFGLRRMISLRSQKNMKKKLFDAGFWLSVAVLCYPWAVLFIFLIVAAVLLYTDGNVRNWLIPFVAISAVFIISYSISLLFDLNHLENIVYGLKVSFDFVQYNSVRFLVGLTVLLSFGLWSSLFYIKNINQKKRDLRPSFYMVIWTVVISFLALIIAPEKSGGELLFMFAPLAIIIANYIEVIREKWFKELFFSALIVVPIVLLFL
ncbi:MAG: DUF6427 family protein [Jejuia sp.]